MSTLYIILWLIDKLCKKTVEKYQKYNKIYCMRKRKKKLLRQIALFGKDMQRSRKSL